MVKRIVEKIFEFPAKALEKGIERTRKLGTTFFSKRPFKLAEEYWHTLGPGLITGAADDDPSGIAAYSQSGAQYGFQLLWLSLFTFPFMSMVQEMCARIGLVTGRGLAANIHQHYSRKLLYTITLLLFLANTFNIAADLGAMAASAKLLNPSLNFGALVAIFAFAILLLQIFTTYAQYAQYLKYLALGLFSYVFAALAAHLQWAEVFHQVVRPSILFTKDQLFLICAVLGTTISPYLFFWQTSQEVEERIMRSEQLATTGTMQVSAREVYTIQIDVWSGMFFSNLIMFFIIAACAATLHMHGITSITTADQAASALRPFAGEFTYFFFALGIIGTGLLATPVLAGSTAYAISESFNWKYGLYRKLKEAYSFYGVIIVSMLIGLIANLVHLDPIKGLIYSAVANGLIAPFILFFIVRLSSNKDIMGEKVNYPFITLCGWIIMIIMIFSGVAAVASIFF